MFNRQQRINVCCEELSNKLRDLCGEKEQMVISHIGTAIKNFIANARYRFVSEDGPKLGIVTLKEPLMHK